MTRNEMHDLTRWMAAGAAIAAVYTVLTFLTAPISFGPIQFRISEALCILPAMTAAAVPGVTIGCFFANLFSGAAPMDVVFGSLATLIGAVGTRALRHRGRLAALPPILSNGIIIPFVLRCAYGAEDLIPYMMVTVMIGEVLAVGVLGNLLWKALRRFSPERLKMDL